MRKIIAKCPNTKNQDRKIKKTKKKALASTRNQDESKYAEDNAKNEKTNICFLTHGDLVKDSQTLSGDNGYNNDVDINDALVEMFDEMKKMH